ncbi:MAG: nitroreductase family deazaflavin-dependent oxidoreductase [Actinomycetota bacterium]
MGLQAELGYRVRPANAAQRATQRMAATPPGAWLFARTAHHLDAWALRLSRGRITLGGLVAGIPVLTVTTTGRKSGQRRTLPLLGVPIGDDIALVGTNFGQDAMPAWYLNLAADPHGEVTYRDRTVPVVAREADDAEWDQVLRAAAGIYPGYDAYRARITNRRIPVLVLVPAASAA